MSPLYGSSGDEAADMEARESLIENSLPQVFEEYDFAAEHGMREPVVFLVDCEDEIGSPMARGWEGDETVDAAIMDNAEETNGDGAAGAEEAERCFTTLARAYSLEDCRREIPEFFPALMPTFTAPYPQEGFLAVVVTAGGAATFTVPFSARP